MSAEELGSWKRGCETRGDLPVRVLIPGSCVGAVLGQKGRVIRSITKESGARLVLEVGQRGPPPPPHGPPHGPLHPPHSPPHHHGRPHLDLSVERVMSIWGEPAETSKAVAQILAIVTEELGKGRDGVRGAGREGPDREGSWREPRDQDDVELRLRGRHELIGRLIGKGGEHVKAMMATTKATVSCAQELIPVPVASGGEARNEGYGPPGPAEVHERTISIRGTMDSVLACEKEVSMALREAWRNFVPRPLGPGTFAPMALHLPPHPQPFPVPYQPYASPVVAPYITLPPLPLNANLIPPLPLDGPAQTETVYLYVPANIVGALIGPKGAHIRNLMRVTGAQVRVDGGGKAARAIKEAKEGKEEETTADEAEEGKPRRRQPAPAAASDSASERNGPAATMRCVVIVGGAESQLRAQFWVYQRVCEARQTYFDEVRLTAECPVPTAALGRVIGRQGHHLKELSRTTNAELHVLKPDDPASDKPPLLRVSAPFNASQACQARLRTILAHHHSNNNDHK